MFIVVLYHPVIAAFPYSSPLSTRWPDGVTPGANLALEHVWCTNTLPPEYTSLNSTQIYKHFHIYSKYTLTAVVQVRGNFGIHFDTSECYKYSRY